MERYLKKIVNITSFPKDDENFYLFIFGKDSNNHLIVLYSEVVKTPVLSIESHCFNSFPLPKTGKIEIPIYGDEILFSILDLDILFKKNEISKKDIEKLFNCKVV